MIWKPSSPQRRPKLFWLQNNEQTAERFSKMIGTKTIETKSTSRTEGLSFKGNPFEKNVSRSLQSSNVVGASSMMSLDMLKQYVLFQGFLNRPILADSPRWYLDKKMRKKCSIPTAPFVPYGLWRNAKKPIEHFKIPFGKRFDWFGRINRRSNGITHFNRRNRNTKCLI